MASCIFIPMPFLFRVALVAVCVWVGLSVAPRSEAGQGMAAAQAPAPAPAAAQIATSGNAYCTPSGTWIGATTDGPAKMPFECMYTTMSGTPSLGTVRGPHSTTADV